jgi:hemoglobin
MRMLLAGLGLVLVGGAGCSDDDGGSKAGLDAGSDAAVAPPDATAQSLCDKYGGAAAIDTVIRKKVIEEQIATDCRISPFFTTLTPTALGHVADCLSIQAQGLFGCTSATGTAITYAGSKDSKGVACRDMKSSHTGLGISKGDFDALIDDVAKGLTAAGVSSIDIGMAAPALVGMQSDIVEKPAVTTPTKADVSKPLCASDAGRPDGG